MFKKILLWSIGTFVLVQAIQIEIPKPKSIDPKAEIVASQEIMTMLKTSCYDCHSYESKIPWYGNVAPLSWGVKGHINDGRAWLNFQEWNTYDESKKQKLYNDIAKTISLRMPLPMYLSLHEEAKLSRSKRMQIRKWAESNMKEEK
ncbi:MAG: heme-binding domain-containing protein [Campylobacterota bacterium]|nr:heme-binding domain-containing protein [Campylobacterota bacterium]